MVDSVYIHWFSYTDLPFSEELLSVEEWQRLQPLNPFLQKRFIQTRGKLRLLLGEYLDCDPRRVPIGYAVNGKPIVENGGIHFNLSHTQEFVVYGFSYQSPVGIDAEFIQPRNIFGLVQRYFCSEEIHWLKVQPTDKRTIDFYRAWVCKEAYVKASSVPLHHGLKNFNTIPLLREEAKTAHWDNVDVKEIKAPMGYRAGVGMVLPT